ncbi:MAG: butyrate kinase [Oscillospiraceae bacterium]|nr:butyrate kinase [Oscillospiraceae bacterium]
MDRKVRVLAINPGSTSTKVALFDDYDVLFSAAIHHTPDELADFPDIQSQLEFRTEMIEKTMLEKGFAMEDVDVFSGRGGGLLSLTGGVYTISDLMVSHAEKGMAGAHPANLAPQIAKQYADKFNKHAVVVNPPSIDEFCDEARITGIKGLYRQSHIHALNQKEIALRFCAERGLEYDALNLIICHLGGGISVTAHNNGRMIDSNDIIKGSGPMTPNRAGDLPYIGVIELAYSGAYTKKELIDRLNKDGGLTDHLGTAEVRDVMKMANEGDHYAEIVFRAMNYQIAKYAGAMAVALRGKVDAIILTGGMSNNVCLTDMVKEYIDWIAEVVVMPGEFELEALAAGAVRVMRGVEAGKTYSGEPVWTNF